MKRFLAILILNFSALIVCAQNNPYAIFGYKVKPQPKPSPIDFLTVRNNSSNSDIKYMIINHEEKVIKLLNDKDSVIRTIPYTDQDIFRWATVDPYATKYPEMNPYGYAGNNPIKNIDINGDTLHTTGSATATASFQQVAESGIGGNGTFSQDANGNWSLSQTDDEVMNMTMGQAAMGKTLDAVISSTKTSSYSLIDNNDALSSKVVVGDNGKAGNQSATPGIHTIDMSDVKAFGSNGALTSAGALGHELKEGFDIQTKNLTTSLQINGAHRDGIRTENAINNNGTGRYDDNRTMTPTQLQVPVVVTVNGVVQRQIITIKVTNGNFSYFDISNNNLPH